MLKHHDMKIKLHTLLTSELDGVAGL